MFGIFKQKDTKAIEITKKVNIDIDKMHNLPGTIAKRAEQAAKKTTGPITNANINKYPGIFGGIKRDKFGGYKESGREVYLNGGSRANTVYYKGGGNEAYVRVGGGFVNLDKNFEKNS